MNTKPIDKTKKSNIKCEHCKYYFIIGNHLKCDNELSPKHGEVNYWNRCKCFEWSKE